MRIRTIKPELFTHESLFDAEQSEQLPLRLAFIGLWCAADREGRFKWEPRRLGVQILPYDMLDFSRVLHALATRGFIQKYRVDDQFFGVIPSFAKHQVLNNRERDSDLPEPTEINACDACPTRDPREDHASKAEGKGMEGKGTGKGRELSCPPSEDDTEILDLIWKNAPPASRERSSKKLLSDAWRKVPSKNRPSSETIHCALNAWNNSQKWRDGFAEGIHLWVKNQQWDNLPEHWTKAQRPLGKLEQMRAAECQEPPRKLKILNP